MDESIRNFILYIPTGLVTTNFELNFFLFNDATIHFLD